MDSEDAVRLRRAISRLARQFNTTATDEGLTPSQASVLAVIAGRGPLSLSELTRVEGINPTMLSRVVGKLADGGLIRREQDPADLRSVTVQATAAGRRVHERIKLQRAQLMSRCADRLPAKQAAQLVDALGALEALADELQGTAAALR